MWPQLAQHRRKPSRFSTQDEKSPTASLSTWCWRFLLAGWSDPEPTRQRGQRVPQRIFSHRCESRVLRCGSFPNPAQSTASRAERTALRSSQSSSPAGARRPVACATRSGRLCGSHATTTRPGSECSFDVGPTYAHRRPSVCHAQDAGDDSKMSANRCHSTEAAFSFALAGLSSVCRRAACAGFVRPGLVLGRAAFGGPITKWTQVPQSTVLRSDRRLTLRTGAAAPRSRDEVMYCGPTIISLR
jgi:hypothetical protein